MYALLAPVLAQVITLGLADRLEGRYVIGAAQKQPDGTTTVPAVRQFDGINTTTPAGRVEFDLRRATISLGYAPTLTLVPLFEIGKAEADQRDREFLVYHRAFLTAEYRWKRTTVALGQTAGYGERDFALEALMPRTTAGTTPNPQNQAAPNNQQNPNAPNGTPQPGGAATGGTAGMGNTGTTGTGNTQGALPADNRPVTSPTKVHFGDFRTFLSISHAVSRALQLRLVGGYTISGGTTPADRQSYPVTSGPDATFTARYAVDPRNSFLTTLTGVYTRRTAEPPPTNTGTVGAPATTGSRAYYVTLTEDYVHNFTRQTIGLLGAGLSFSSSRPDSFPLAPNSVYLPRYSIYPVFRAGFGHSARLAQGIFTVTADVNTQPVMDLNYAYVDPRVGANLGVMWTRERFSLVGTASSTISIQRNQTESGQPAVDVHPFDSILTTMTARYDLGAGFGADLGTRTTFQRYNGQNTIPQTWVIFAGITYVFLQPFNEQRPRKAAAAGGGGAAPAGDNDKGGAATGAAGGGAGKGGGAAPAGAAAGGAK